MRCQTILNWVKMISLPYGTGKDGGEEPTSDMVENERVVYVSMRCDLYSERENLMTT